MHTVRLFLTAPSRAEEDRLQAAIWKVLKETRIDLVLSEVWRRTRRAAFALSPKADEADEKVVGALCFMRIRFICAPEMIVFEVGKPIGIQQDLICSLQFSDDGKDDDGEVAIYALLPPGDSIR